MEQEHIKELLSAKPFFPLRVRTGVGRTLDIQHLDLAVLSTSLLVVAMPVDHPVSGIPDQISFCPVEAITRIDALRSKRSQTAREK